MNTALPQNTVNLIRQTPPNMLASILHDVLFSMQYESTVDEVKGVRHIINERPDATECGAAIDICAEFIAAYEIPNSLLNNEAGMCRQDR